METLLGILLLGFATILQTTIASQIPLLQGTVDLVLLTFLAWALREEISGIWQWGLIAGLSVGFASQLPIWLPVSTYMLITLFIQLLKTKIWQVRVISLFTTTILATFLVLGLQWAFIVVQGVPINFVQAFNLVILPSMVLNLLIAFPIYVLMGELTMRIYPPTESS
ncbi:MAG: hypothetical protein IH859_03965 [Chloroflexi bacterium]|nr:hypothetical protein [Chloroflexota bacterium]